MMRNKRLSTFDTASLVIGRIMMWMLLTIAVLNGVIFMGKLCGIVLTKLAPIFLSNITITIIVGVFFGAVIAALVYCATSVRLYKINGKPYFLFRRIIKRNKRNFCSFNLKDNN